MTWLPILAHLLLLYRATSLRLDKCHSRPLGMESGTIVDSQITASSSFDQQSVGPQNARIRTELASGAWCPKSQITAKSYEYLQVDLNKTHIITAVETQGRYGNGTGKEYATYFMLDYLRDGCSIWIRYRNRSGAELLNGNNDTFNAALTALDPPIIASRIRFVPTSRQTRTMCMRVEIHGCINTDGLMFYSSRPKGSRIGAFDFKDKIAENTTLYDEDGSLRSLGILSDGVISQKMPFDDGLAENEAWIGWSKGATGGHVNMTFEFDTIRNFSSMEFHAFGERIEQIDAIFSQDGKNFPLASQISSIDQTANRTMRIFSLKLPLHKRPGRVLKVNFRFGSDWFFLSEVNFNTTIQRRPIEINFKRIVLYNHVEEQSEKEILIEPESASTVSKSMLLILSLLLFAILLATCFICCFLCLRQRRPREKQALDIYDEETPRNAMIVTTMGSNRTYPTHSYINQLNSMFSGDKTVSTSLSSKSNGSGKTEPPSWADFHFPPPPRASSESGYADPSQTLPLLSSQNTPIHRPKQLSNTMNPKKHKIYVDDSLHYATSNIFTTYGFDSIKKVNLADIEFGDDLGEGKFTLVRECRAPGLKRAAHKCAKDRGNLHARKALLDELRVLSTIRHPRIIGLIAMDEEAGMLLELAEFGDIRSLLKSHRRIGLDNLLSICADVCAGMEHLEVLGIVHGHLAPGNVLIDNNLRAKVSAPRGKSHHAQLRYSAPESIILNEWSNKSDMWAYAVTTWEIVQFCERLPFEGFSNVELMDNAERTVTGEKDTLVLAIPHGLPRAFFDVLSASFRSNPSLRPSFSDICPQITNFYQDLDD